MIVLLLPGRRDSAAPGAGERISWRPPGRSALAFVLGLALVGCSAGESSDDAVAASATPGAAPPARSETARPSPADVDTVPGHPSWTEGDLATLRSTVAWALENGLDTLDVGDRVARLGERFVGTAYVPKTLDPPGPERLVVNLHAFDCVTFVESMLALAHVVQVAGTDESSLEAGALMNAFDARLRSLRYRRGELLGYPSRLHYFSEWIRDNGSRGNVVDVTAELGGVPDPEPRTFMTAHREAYWQLADPSTFEAVARMERSLEGVPRSRVPEERVAEVADRIRSGDIIAATSTLPGLDIAHTGIALWKDGVLRLMHAPLVGEAVQISDLSLAERLLSIGAQDGIMVARPIKE